LSTYEHIIESEVKMSTKKIMTAEEIRMELARRRMTRASLARKIGISADYMRKILRDQRSAEGRRAQISEYLDFDGYEELWESASAADNKKRGTA
jgi:transcriptional regulator with XRE-family HTH domain